MVFDPKGQDLTTTARLKPYLNLASSDTSNDAALDQLVSAASNFFLSLTNRTAIYSATYTETRNGNGNNWIIPRNLPVTAVSAVSDGQNSIPASTGPGISGFSFDDGRIFLIGSRFCRGLGNVSLSYTAGFPAMAGSPLAPQDYRMLAMERAVIAMAAAWWKRNAHWDEVSHSFGGQMVFTFSQKDIPAEAQTIVNQFSDRAVRW